MSDIPSPPLQKNAQPNPSTQEPGGEDTEGETTQRDRLWKFLKSVLPHDFYEHRQARTSKITMETMLLNSRIFTVVNDINVLIPKTAADILRADKVRRKILMDCPMLETLQGIEEEIRVARKVEREAAQQNDPNNNPSRLAYMAETPTPRSPVVVNASHTLPRTSVMAGSQYDELRGLDQEKDILNYLVQNNTQAMDRESSTTHSNNTGKSQTLMSPRHMTNPRRACSQMSNHSILVSPSETISAVPWRHNIEDVSLRTHVEMDQKFDRKLYSRQKKVFGMTNTLTSDHRSKDLIHRCQRSLKALPPLGLTTTPFMEEETDIGRRRSSNRPPLSIPSIFLTQKAEERVQRAVPFLAKSIRPQSRV
eukprot:PhF_6_TR10995/c0_g1_i1/m.17794